MGFLPREGWTNIFHYLGVAVESKEILFILKGKLTNPNSFSFKNGYGCGHYLI